MAWWQLDSILKEQSELFSYYRAQLPVACRHCGEPLRQGPPSTPSVLYCPWGHYQYPRDYDPDLDNGM